MEPVPLLRTISISIAVLCLAPAAAQQDGMIPRWQVEEVAENLVDNMERTATVVGALRPADWVDSGASRDYIGQHATLQQEMENVRLSAQAMGREPERLTYAVDTFLWLERTAVLLDSVAAGVRRYSNPVLADLLDSARSRNAEGTATVLTYMRQLAVHIEGEMEVAHAEAQRCRQELIQER